MCVVYEVGHQGARFSGIQEALAAADRELDPAVPLAIHLAPGIYRERVEIRRANVTLEGECAASTKIVSSDGALDVLGDGERRGTFRTYAVLVDADGCTLRSLTVENDAGDGRTAGQAIALYADGDRFVCDGCEILGHQDTLFLGPLPPKEMKPGGFKGPKEKSPRRMTRQYFRRCLIAGDVDFIFGSACAYFDGCEIRSLDRGKEVNGYVTASSTPAKEPYGFVFHGCSFTGVAAARSVYLGRPWREHAKCVLSSCWLGSHIRQDGWFGWGRPEDDLGFAGIGLLGPGAEGLQWPSYARLLEDKDAARFSRTAVLAGRDGWDPLSGAEEPTETARLSANGRTLHETRYLADDQAMERLFERSARSARFKGSDAASWRRWQATARERLSDVLGLTLMEPCQGEARLMEQTLLSCGIERRRYELMVEPEVWMPFYLLVPEHPRRGQDGRFLAAVCPHGHQGAGAASVAGIMGVPAVDEAIRRFNYDYGLRMARLGYIVACPEARGWGARRSWKGQGDAEELYLRGTCANEARMAEPLGRSLLGELVFDLERLVDWLSLREEISSGELACVGFSGGGMQTLYLAALDERIAKVFISGYLYGAKDALLHLNGNCSCNYVPGLWRLFDMGDIASLIAPRPLLVQSADHDHLMGPRGLANVEEQMEIVRAAYHLLGADASLRHQIVAGEHHFGTEGFAENLGWLDSLGKERI
ncbi:MAG: pectinesterase family protein [Olsenella sp.]|nr:pectinesterase family protein [Olsenella sp.]